MNVMNGFVTSSTLATAVDVNDLHPVTDVPVASLLPIVTMACFIALLILIVAIVIMSRPRRAKRVAAPRGSHNALAPVSQWKSRVHDIVERNGAGKLSREDALIEKRLSDPDTYARFKPEDIAWANTRRAAIAKETATLEEEWLEVSARLEAA